MMTFSIQRDNFAGVLYANTATPPPDAQIDVVDIGDEVGFPQLILARRDARTGELYGITVRDEQAFREAAENAYGTDNVRRALTLLLKPLTAGWGHSPKRNVA